MVIKFVRKSWTDQILFRTRRQVTYIPVVKSLDPMTGDETLTDGTPEVIEVVFLKRDQMIKFAKDGEFETADAYVLINASASQDVEHNDKFEVNGFTYRVEDAVMRYGDNDNEVALFKFVRLFLYSQ